MRPQDSKSCQAWCRICFLFCSCDLVERTLSMAKMSENNGPKEDAMTTPISSLAVSPETARVIQAQMAVATGRPALLMGVIVAAVVSAVFTVVVLGIVGVMVRGAFETGNLLFLAGAGLLLILAIPYFVLFQTLRVFRASKA